MDKVTSVVATEFSVKFDGSALDEHSMDVSTLAPSLLALADGVNLAHQLIGDDSDGEPTLKIKAHREGSFEVAMLVAATAVFTDPAAQALITTTGVNLLEVIKSTFRGIRWLRNRRPESIEPDPDDQDAVVYKMADGSTLSVPKPARIMIENGDFRVIADRFTKPLDEEGIDSVDIIEQGSAEPDLRITSADRDAFSYSPEDALVADYERDGVLTVTTIQLEDGLLWRFHEGDVKFTAKVEDADFLLRVRLGRQTIGSRDKLHVRLQEQIYRRSDQSPRIVRTVVRVLHVERAPVQGEFDLGPID